MVRKGRHQWDTVRHGETHSKTHSETQWDTWWDTMRRGEIRWDAVRHDETWWDSVRHHEIQWDTVTRWDMVRHGETWFDTVRHGETRWDSVINSTIVVLLFDSSTQMESDWFFCKAYLLLQWWLSSPIFAPWSDYVHAWRIPDSQKGEIEHSSLALLILPNKRQNGFYDVHYVIMFTLGEFLIHRKEKLKTARWHSCVPNKCQNYHDYHYNPLLF